MYIICSTWGWVAGSSVWLKYGVPKRYGLFDFVWPIRVCVVSMNYLLPVWDHALLLQFILNDIREDCNSCSITRGDAWTLNYFYPFITVELLLAWKIFSLFIIFFDLLLSNALGGVNRVGLWIAHSFFFIGECTFSMTWIIFESIRLQSVRLISAIFSS